MKQCFKCHETKSLDEFYKHPQTTDGRLGKCKTCTKKDVQENYIDKIHQYRKYEYDRNQKIERRKQRQITQKRHRAKNPDKYHARMALGNAVKSGKILKNNCEQCGSTESEAHHHDYSKPLEVTWLCFKCHRQVHGQMING